MNGKKLLIPFFLTMGLLSCGEAVLNLDDSAYEPKIVIEGYVLPGQRVQNIRISRNFPLNKEINLYDYPLKDAEVILTDLGEQKSYPLTFNFGQLGFEYRGDDLAIRPGASYKLSVSAKIDGEPLQAAATTTVPRNGFRIDKAASQLEPMTYRERDESGELKFFTVAFYHSSGTNFYVMSIVAQEASPETFIEDNVLGVKKEDLDEELLRRLKYENRWIQAAPDEKIRSSMKILWLDTWFYGKYRVILYAGDDNFKQYFLTHRNVQDIDGNLYEPRFNIEGDGIGVFGSALADTVHFEILRAP